jgi:uncharacterized hydrophobic protein (TIGR00271 family)
MNPFSKLFHYFFNLNSDDRAEEADVVIAIQRSISFRGPNLWTLIFAIIIASVGLNVNSTAVIIGAMLISPLMGPIMGVALGVTVADTELIRRALKNLMIAVVFSIATSSLYFYLTPLHGVTSELLTRTTPAVWDVLIGFSGGIAGAVGITRKERGNVIPGVAIATALMPPLCTVGYGLATQHWYFALGAVYLFFINSVFICVATVIVLRLMHFHRRSFQTHERRQRVMRYIVLVVMLTVAPSIWLSYRIVQKAFFESAAASFVSKEFHFAATQVVSKNFIFDSSHPKIELLLIGQVLDSTQIQALSARLHKYKLDNTQLVVRQGMDAARKIDFAQIRASVLEEVMKTADSFNAPKAPPPAAPDPGLTLRPEIAALFPKVRAYSIGKSVFFATDSMRSDSVITAVMQLSKRMSAAEQKQLEAWMAARHPGDSVQVIYR